MRRWFVLVFMVALMLPVTFLMGSPNGQALAQQDAPGCEGLAVYRDEMYAVGRYLNDAGTEAGLDDDRGLLTYSSDDWTAYADIALEVQRQLKAIAPPVFAADYHQTLIETFGLFEQVGRTAAKNGAIGLLEQYSDMIDELGQRRLSATTAATAICADFEEVDSTWGNQSTGADGSPVANTQEVAATEVTEKPSPTPAVQTIATRFETSGTGSVWADVNLIPGTYFFRFDCDAPGGTAGIYLPAVGPETIQISSVGTQVAIPGIGDRLVIGLLNVKCDGSWTLVGTPSN
jgi:hypothetical protein